MGRGVDLVVIVAVGVTFCKIPVDIGKLFIYSTYMDATHRAKRQNIGNKIMYQVTFTSRGFIQAVYHNVRAQGAAEAIAKCLLFGNHEKHEARATRYDDME